MKHSTYLAYQAARSKYTAVPDSFTYSSFYFKGLVVGDTCGGWNTYKDNSLNLPFDDIKFTSVSLRFDYVNFERSTNRSMLAQCNSPVVVKAIIKSLRTGGTLEQNCNGITWRVFSCNDNVVLCVNCKRICVSTEYCPGTAFTINPCSPCKTHAAASTVANFQYGLQKLYPQFTRPLRVAPDRTSLKVSGNVTVAGNIYCAALPPLTTIQSVLDIRALATTAIVTADQLHFTLRIPNLSPTSPYRVMCYSDDFSTHSMILSDALLTNTTVSTTCCKSLLIGNVPANIVQYLPTTVRPENFFTVALDAPPLTNVVVTVTAKLVKCSPSAPALLVSDVVVLPSTFSFGPAATVLSGSFVVRTSVLGCYVLTATSSGTGPDQYSSASVQISVNSFRSPPAVPTLASVYLSNDGTSVLFAFDSATDKGAEKIVNYEASFACSALVSFIGSSTATCKWADNSTLSANFVSSPTKPSVGETATFLGGKVKAVCVDKTTCSVYTFVPTTALVIAAPLVPLVPVAALTTLPTIALCDDMFLDPTPSRGAAGRSWLSVQWMVIGVGNAQNADVIATFLNTYYQTTTSVARVPNAFLTPSTRYVDSSYEITLKLTNFFGQTSFSKVSVLVGNGIGEVLPQIRLFGADIQFSRWKPLSLFATASFPTCVQNTSTLPLYYSWKVYEGLQYLPAIQSTSVAQRYFKLNAYTLEASRTYTISVEVSFAPGGIASKSLGYASGKIQVGQSGVSAIIAGGATRSFSAADAIALDASESVDVDYPAALLTYLWSCQQYLPTFGSTCSGFTPSSGSVLRLAVGTLATGPTYNLSVTVSNAARFTSTASVLVLVSASPVPDILIASTKLKYNAQEKIILTGQITAPLRRSQAVWSSSSLSLTSAGSAVSPLRKTLESGFSTFQLSLSANTLVSGLSYIFHLQCAYVGNTATASALVTILMNVPPQGGVLIALPSTGIALSTVYDIRATGWNDDATDFPLAYGISYYLLDSRQRIVLKEVNSMSYVNAMLGQGLASLDYKVNCVVTVADIYIGSNNATTTTIVRPASSSDAISVSTGALTAALSNMDPMAVTSVIGAALASVNSVICSVPTPCATLHRTECQASQRTCGACLPGYAGVPGDANVPCYAVDQLRSVGSSCVSNSTCITGSCVIGICSDVSKTCTDSCSGFGDCKYFDQFGNQISTCLVSDPTCSAQCVCNSDRYGATCAFRKAAFEQLVTFREHLCSSLFKSIEFQDPSEPVISARALSIIDILTDINQISDEALDQCAAALVTSVEQNPVLSCTGNGLSLVTGALSSILKRGRKLSSELLITVYDTLTSLSVGCQSNIVVGETPLTIENDNIRLLTAVVAGNSASTGRFFSPPQSTFEVINKKSSPAVALQNYNSTNAVGVMVMELKSNPRGLATNSSRLGFRFQLYDAQSTTQRRQLRTHREIDSAEYSIVLQNQERINYVHTEKTYLTFACSRPYQEQTYQLSGECPGGIPVSFECPSRTKRLYNVSCPAHVQYPSCTQFDGSDFNIAPSCKVMSYTPDNTTCLCTTADSDTRRALQSSSSNVVEYSSRMSVQRTPYAVEIVNVPSLLAVTNGAAIPSIFAVIGLIYCAGLVYCLFWEAKSVVQKYRKHEEEKPKVPVRTVNVFFDLLLPDEFRRADWTQRLWNQLRLEHPFLAPWAPHNNPSESIERWTVAMGALLVLIFANTLVARQMYADDGECEKIIFEDECEASYSTGRYFQSCYWREDNQACAFNRPEITFLTTILLTLIVSVLCAPLEQVWKYAVQHLFALARHQRSLVSVAVSVEEAPVLQHKNDEFSVAMTRPAKVMRGARLTRAQQHIDSVTEEAETLHVQKKMETNAVQSNFRSLQDVVSTTEASRVHYGLRASWHWLVHSAVVLARQEAAVLQSQMNQIEESQIQEDFLMRHFICHLFSGVKRPIVYDFFFRQVPAVKLARTNAEAAHQYFSLLLLPVYVIVVVYFIFAWNEALRSRSDPMWLMIALITLLQKVFLIDFGKIWFLWVIVYPQVAADVRMVCEALSQRSRLVLRRTHGVLNRFGDMVQHFNPACRVARLHPALPVARLLFSMNDSDLLLRPPTTWSTFPSRVVAAMLTPVFLLPKQAQDAVLNLSIIAVLDFGLIALYFADKFSPILLAFVVVVIVGLVLLVSYPQVMYVYKRCLSSVRTRLAIEPVLQDFDFEDEASFQPSPVKKGAPPAISTRSSLCAEFSPLKLKNGQMRVVKQPVYHFKPFSTLAEMNRQYGVTNLLDKDIAYIGEVGEVADAEAIATEKRVGGVITKKRTNLIKGETKEEDKNSWPSSLHNALILQTIHEDNMDTIDITDSADPSAINNEDCDVISVISENSPSYAGSPYSKHQTRNLLFANNNDAIYNLGNDHDSASYSANSVNSLSEQGDNSSGSPGRYYWNNRATLAPPGPSSVHSASHFSVGGAYGPVTSSFLTLPQTPNSHVVSDTKEIRSVLSSMSSAADDKRHPSPHVRLAPLPPAVKKSIERFTSPEKGPLNTRNLNTASYRYRQFAQMPSRYTDLPAAAPGGTSTAESIEDIKQSHIGVPSSPIANRHDETPAYFARRAHSRKKNDAAPAAPAFAGPGRILVAHEHNELPSFPLMY